MTHSTLYLQFAKEGVEKHCSTTQRTAAQMPTASPEPISNRSVTTEIGSNRRGGSVDVCVWEVVGRLGTVPRG